MNMMAVGMARSAHAKAVKGGVEAQASTRRHISPLVDRLMQGKRLLPAQINTSMDKFFDEIEDSLTVVAVADHVSKDNKTRSTGVVYLHPTESGSVRYYDAVSASKYINTRRMLGSTRRYPVRIHDHVVERFSSRGGTTPHDFFADERFSDAFLLTAGYLMAAGPGTVPISLPYGDNCLLGFVQQEAYENHLKDNAFHIDKHGQVIPIPFNWMDEQQRSLRVTTYVDSDQMWKTQDNLNSVLREFIGVYRQGLASIMSTLAFDFEGMQTGDFVLTPSGEEAMDALKIVMASDLWKASVRMPRPNSHR